MSLWQRLWSKGATVFVDLAWELPSQRMESLGGVVMAEALEQRGEDVLVSLGSCQIRIVMPFMKPEHTIFGTTQQRQCNVITTEANVCCDANSAILRCGGQNSEKLRKY